MPGDLKSPAAQTLAVGEAGAVVAYRNANPGDRFRAFMEQTTLAFVRSGTKCIGSEGIVATVAPGDFVVMLPGAHVMAEVAPGRGAYESLVLCLSDTLLASLWAEHPSWFGRPSRSGRQQGVRVATTSGYLRQVVDGLPFALQGASSPELIRIKLTELCLSLRETDAWPVLSEAARRASTQGDRRLRRVVEQHRLEPLSVEELARLSARSLSAFKRDFQRLFAQSPGRWLRRERLDHARFMLSSSDSSVTEVGQLSGFSDVSSFIRAFRGAYGETPKQYQLRSHAQL